MNFFLFAHFKGTTDNCHEGVGNNKSIHIHIHVFNDSLLRVVLDTSVRWITMVGRGSRIVVYGTLYCCIRYTALLCTVRVPQPLYFSRQTIVFVSTLVDNIKATEHIGYCFAYFFPE